MSKTAFSPANILLPRECGLTKWAVVACDQYTSQPEYWERVDKYVGDAPSTLRLILPESKLESNNVDQEIEKINHTMEQYLADGRLQELEDAMLLLERKLSNGKTRLGLLGKLDLEQYSYEKGSGTPIRATEGTVLSRIPPRMKVRRNAPIELPHIMVLIDDPQKEIIEPLATDKAKKEMSGVYMTSLMERGGRIAAHLLSKKQAEKVEDQLAALGDPQRFAETYHAEGKPVLVYAMGDGNHSFATAKAHWENVKKTLTPEQQKTHPARFALCELVNIHDESLLFEPIHRVLFGTDASKWMQAAEAALASADGSGYAISLIAGNQRRDILAKGASLGEAIAAMDTFCAAYLAENGGTVDYIHGDDEALDLAAGDGCCGILMPRMDKTELFTSVLRSGPFPKKSFSIGLGADKRYYLECRKL